MTGERSLGSISRTGGEGGGSEILRPGPAAAEFSGPGIQSPPPAPAQLNLPRTGTAGSAQAREEVGGRKIPGGPVQDSPARPACYGARVVAATHNCLDGGGGMCLLRALLSGWGGGVYPPPRE